MISRIGLTLIAILFFSSKSYCQHFEDLDADQPQNALASGEIQIVNRANDDIRFNYSLNKKSWKPKLLLNNSGILATLEISDPWFYIRICNVIEGVTICDVYKLRPRKRYIISYSDELGKVIIKS